MKKTKLMIALLAGLTLGACSNDNDELTPQPKQEPLFPLTIEVTENPMTQDGEEGSDATRSDITTGTTFNSFNMSYVDLTTPGKGGPIEASKSETGKWSSEGSWPYSARTNDYMVNWYAYTGGTFHPTGDESASSEPYINFSVDETVDNQKDLLVATTAKKWSECNGNLSFAFDHVCSALRFWVKKSTNLNDKTVSVSSIVLKNVIKNGKYYYGTDSWTLGTESTDITDFTLYSGSPQTLGSTDYTAMDGGTPCYLFLVPQTLTPWSPTGTLGNTYLEVTCSINGGASQTAYVPFGTSFEKGKKYDVKINIGKNSLYSGPNTKLIP